MDVDIVKKESPKRWKRLTNLCWKKRTLSWKKLTNLCAKKLTLWWKALTNLLRRLDPVWATILGGLIAFVLWGPLHDGGSVFFRYLTGNWAYWRSFALVSLMNLLIGWALTRYGYFRWHGWNPRGWFGCLSLWPFALVGAAVVALLAARVDGYTADRRLFVWVGVWCLLGPYSCCFLMAWIEKAHRGDQTPLADELRQKSFARYLLERVLEPQARLIMLFGEFGAGKTYVTTLMKELAEEARYAPRGVPKPDAQRPRANKPPAPSELPHLVKVRIVDVWGQSEKGIQEHVLAELSEAAAELVDWPRDQGLYNMFRQFLEASTGKWSGFVDLVMGRRHDFSSRLEVLNERLLRVGAWIILVVEDLDRNKLGRPARNEIHSLLDRLKNLSQVRVVITLSSRSEDLERVVRLCDDVLHIPPLALGARLQIIVSAMNEMIGGTTTEEPPDRTTCEVHRRLPRSMQEYYRHHLVVMESRTSTEETVMGVELATGKPWRDLIGAMALITSTPRMLNRVVEAAMAMWSRCGGEVDLAQLWVICILRIRCPGIYSFILTSHAHLSLFSKWQGNSEKGAYIAGLKRGLSEVIDKENLDSEQDTAVRSYLLKILYSRLDLCNSSQGKQHVGNLSYAVVQDASSNSGREYWYVLLNGRRPDSEVTDASLLQRLERLMVPDGEEASSLSAELVESPALARRVERISPYLRSAGEWKFDGKSLLGGLFLRVLERHIEQQSGGEPTIRDAWNIEVFRPLKQAIDHVSDGVPEKHNGLIRQAMDACQSLRLPILMLPLVHFENDVALSRPMRSEVVRRFVRTLSEFTQSGKSIEGWLSSGFPNSIRVLTDLLYELDVERSELLDGVRALILRGLDQESRKIAAEAAFLVLDPADPSISRRDPPEQVILRDVFKKGKLLEQLQFSPEDRERLANYMEVLQVDTKSDRQRLDDAIAVLRGRDPSSIPR